MQHTAFLLLEAPDRDYFERTLLDGSFSGDWFRPARPRRPDETAEQLYTATISSRVDHVSAELDRHLEALQLGNRELVLAGFSQGSAIAA